MHDDLPDAVLKAPLADIGIEVAYQNRLEEALRVFDVASLLACGRDRVAGVIGDAALQEILDSIESLRGQTDWQLPRPTRRRKPR